MSTCELSNHCRSDPVQVQSTGTPREMTHSTEASCSHHSGVWASAHGLLRRCPHTKCKIDTSETRRYKATRSEAQRDPVGRSEAQRRKRIHSGFKEEGTTVIKGTWCSGITSASHAEGPGFKSQCVQYQFQIKLPIGIMLHGYGAKLMNCGTQTGYRA